MPPPLYHHLMLPLTAALELSDLPWSGRLLIVLVVIAGAILGMPSKRW